MATNSDASYPAPGGELWPGAGALLAAVETATGVRAEVAGKPHRPLFDEAVRIAGTRRALVVGDRIETDIEGAVDAGLDCALALSGAARPADLLDARRVPVAVLKDVAGLLERPAVLVREAQPEDREAVAGLIRAAGLDVIPGDADSGRTFLAETDDGLVATATVEHRGREAYLRSVAVREDHRRAGVGVLVVAAATQAAAADGAVELFLHTRDARGFFERLGFEALEREKAPRWIEEGESARYCAEDATLMRRDLRDRRTRPDAAG